MNYAKVKKYSLKCDIFLISYERGTNIMEKTKIRKKLSDSSKSVLKNVAIHYANVACPFFTYQPKISEEVKKLRKF